jgi:hypothetical protein
VRRVTARGRGALFIGVLALATVAACGGDDDNAGADESSTTVLGSTIAPTTTQPAAPGSEAPPATDAPVPVYPLTGLPVTDPVAAARPALVVKIDNNEKARPQTGLNEADIVFEEIVEIQTRFAAVFHSQTADPVGPIRSGRTQDIDLLGSFNQPLFMWSGGNAAVTRAIEDSDLVNLSAQHTDVYQAAGFFRSDDRPNPHDLYASTTAGWTLAPEGAGPPQQQFTYRSADDEPVGEPAAGCNGDMDGLAVGWTYDSSAGNYLRTTNGQPHMDVLSGQVSTENVVVMFVEYRPSPADARSPEAQTIGTGEAWVFTGGVLVRGTWSRADRFSGVVLTDSSGQLILLTPGRTFIELAKAGSYQPT